MFLKAEIINFYFFFFYFSKWMSFLLYLIPFNMYGTEGTGRTYIFATSTAYTNIRINMWNSQSVFVRYHRKCLGGAMF